MLSSRSAPAIAERDADDGELAFLQTAGAFSAPERLQQQALTSETVATARGGYLNLVKPARAQVALVAALHPVTAPRQHAQRPSYPLVRRSSASATAWARGNK